jgi:hypothetical protein
MNPVHPQELNAERNPLPVYNSYSERIYTSVIVNNGKAIYAVFYVISKKKQKYPDNSGYQSSKIKKS